MAGRVRLQQGGPKQGRCSMRDEVLRGERDENDAYDLLALLPQKVEGLINVCTAALEILCREGGKKYEYQRTAAWTQGGNKGTGKLGGTLREKRVRWR